MSFLKLHPGATSAAFSGLSSQWRGAGDEDAAATRPRDMRHKLRILREMSSFSPDRRAALLTAARPDSDVYHELSNAIWPVAYANGTASDL